MTAHSSLAREGILYKSAVRKLMKAMSTDVVKIAGEAKWHRSHFKMHLCHGRDRVAGIAGDMGWRGFEAPMPTCFAKAVDSAGKGLVIDVGANTGFYTLLALAVSGSVTVSSYEPMTEVRQLLLANIKLNSDRHRVTILPYALSNEVGLCRLFVPDGSHGLIETSASLSEKFKGGTGYSYDIQSTTLDTMHAGSQRVAVIKVDAESYDLKVLLGAERILMRDRPVVFLEVLSRADEDGLASLLNRCNYTDVVLRSDGATEARYVVKHDPSAWNHMWIGKEHLHKLPDFFEGRPADRS